MAVNTRTEYALRILIELADNIDHPISAHKVCEAQKLPKKYIEHLLALLKNAGIIYSSAGSQGGYRLSRLPDEISFADVLKAVDDNSFDTACAGFSSAYCIGPSCALADFFNILDEKLNAIFGSYSLADIMKFWKKDR